jgi:hypothetical protein
MLHTYIQKFDVTGTAQIFFSLFAHLNAAYVYLSKPEFKLDRPRDWATSLAKLGH